MNPGNAVQQLQVMRCSNTSSFSRSRQLGLQLGPLHSQECCERKEMLSPPEAAPEGGEACGWNSFNNATTPQRAVCGSMGQREMYKLIMAATQSHIARFQVEHEVS